MAKNRHPAPAAAGVPEIKFFETHAAGAMLRVITKGVPEIRNANSLEQRRFMPDQQSRAGESRFINGAHDWRDCGISAA